MKIRFDDKVALVTGASSGIGRACAKEFAKTGAKVVVHYNVSKSDADAVVTSIINDGGEAIALQADGWFLRSQIPWVKRSSMPESVTDRPATAIEYVYLLSKSKSYFWDAESIKQDSVDPESYQGRRPRNQGAHLQWRNPSPL